MGAADQPAVVFLTGSAADWGAGCPWVAQLCAAGVAMRGEAAASSQRKCARSTPGQIDYFKWLNFYAVLPQLIWCKCNAPKTRSRLTTSRFRQTSRTSMWTPKA